jgi:hypothetical protein
MPDRKKGGLNAASTKTKSAPVVVVCHRDRSILLFGKRGNFYTDEYSLSSAVRPASVSGG